jgi:hypothetical protein
LRKLRAWLGLPAALAIHLPITLVHAISRSADALGWLGWRSPLRTTAITELAAGVTGDPRPWRNASGASLSSLESTLRRLPSTVQDCWFARLFLLKPLAIAGLAAFWILSGLIAFVQFDTAVTILTKRGISLVLACVIVISGAMLDLLIGMAAVFRATVRVAAAAMICVTGLYLLGGTILAPELWLDPLGPLVKTIPGVLLALIVLAIAEDR